MRVTNLCIISCHIKRIKHGEITYLLMIVMLADLHPETLMTGVTASAASPDKRCLEPICQRTSELRVLACGRRWGGESLSWMQWVVADSQCSHRSCIYIDMMYIIIMTMLELTRYD